MEELKRKTATITSDNLGDIYTIYNAAGVVALLIEVDDDGGRLSTRNNDGNQVTFFGAGESGDGLVNVNKGNGDTVVFLNVDEDGGRISTRNNDAQSVTLIAADTLGQGRFSTTNADGTQVTFLGADDEGEGLINLRNTSGDTVHFLSVDEDGGRIDVQSTNGGDAVLIAVDSRGQGLVQVSGDRVHDTAEVFDLTTRSGVIPGSVMAADASGSGALVLAAMAYERRAVGVVSGAGDFQHGIVIGVCEDGSRDLPIAMSGQVYVRVTRENGPIVPGDLLVSSSTPGVAMRAGDMQMAFGAVIGKALQSYGRGGEGLVRMLVMVR